MNAPLDLPRRLFRSSGPVTLTQAWDAPSIQTHDYCREACGPTWAGFDSAPNAGAQCAARPHYVAIETEAQRVGWPVAYKRDLYVHDRNALARLPRRVPFVFVLRDNGTHLFPVGERDGVGHDAAHFAVSCPDCFGRERCRVYTWDGARLRQHATPEDAADAARDLDRVYRANRGRP
jgi:hypothetical protein